MQRFGTDGFIYCYNSLYRLLFLWGVITFRLQSQHHGGPKSTTMSILFAFGVRCALIFGFVAGVYVKLSDRQMSQAMFSHLSPLVKIIFTWECLSCIVTYALLCLTLDFNRLRHIQLLASMQLLDTEISSKFSHVRWRYQRTRSKYWYGTAIITSCYVAISLVLMFDTTRCICGYVSTILIASAYSLITSTLGVLGLTHVGLMDYLRLRYRLIIKLVAQQYEAGIESFEPHNRMEQLFEFSKRCNHLLMEVNDVFGFVGAACMFYDFTHMTCFVYMLCQKMLRYEPWDTQHAFISLHLVIHVYKVVIASTYGYQLGREKRKCLRLLSNYASHFDSLATMRDQMDCFQYWSMHNNQTATMSNSFPCNISLIFLVFNALANYVIVLVQLLFQLQVKDIQAGHTIPIPADVELIK